jgi:hypothetical protein
LVAVLLRFSLLQQPQSYISIHTFDSFSSLPVRRLFVFGHFQEFAHRKPVIHFQLGIIIAAAAAAAATATVFMFSIIPILGLLVCFSLVAEFENGGVPLPPHLLAF